MAARDERLDRIPEMHAAGMTYAQIAEELGVSENIVVSAGSALGITRHGWATTRRHIAELVEAGLSDAEIAKKTNRKKSLVTARRASMVSLNTKMKRQRHDERVAKLRKGFTN